MAQQSVDRAVLLAAAASDGLAPAQVASLPIGRRDALLLKLREGIFGSEATAAAKCPECAEALEFTLATTDWLANGPPYREQAYEVASNTLSVTFRLPDSTDVKAIASCPDVASGKRLLLQRCIQHVSGDGVAIEGDALDEELVAEIGFQMAERDPLADIVLAMECALCGHAFSAVFDVSSFVWQELDALAKGLLLEVHTLARAYGWGEAEILSMSSSRRQHYLELAG